MDKKPNMEMRAIMMHMFIGLAIEFGYTQKLLLSDIRKVWKPLTQKAQSND